MPFPRSAPASAKRTLALGVLTTLLAAFVVGLVSIARATVHDAFARKADTLTVRQLGQKLDQLSVTVDSGNRAVTVKLDSANLRLRQIVCGPAIDKGCR